MHSSLRRCKIITYANYTSSSDIHEIQSKLSQDLDNLLLSNWFCDNELILNLKKGKYEVTLFRNGKRFNVFHGLKSSSQLMVLPSTPLHVVSTSACTSRDLTVNFETQPLMAHPFMHWYFLSVDTKARVNIKI